MIIDPRDGDAEDDASSTKSRSLLAIAGSLLAEISLTKLLLAWIVILIVPGVVLGMSLLVATSWLSTISSRIAALAGLGPLIAIAAIAAVGWFGFRPLMRGAERGFWSLNSIVVQPYYALCREGLRHLAELFLTGRASEAARARLRAATAAGAGLVACAVALAIVAAVWPATLWATGVEALTRPLHLIVPALANAAVIIGLYLAAASLLWGAADATMDQPRDLQAFDEAPADAPRWRVAHLSDVHVVGEQYGFRIESGRLGPRGNERLGRVLDRLDAIHASDPLDFVLITGDMTDAGRSSEWAAFLDLVSRHPALAQRTFILPGNHDVNIVDRNNPARLELPMSPGKRLRQMRALSAMDAVQGSRVHVFDHARQQLGGLLSEALDPHRRSIREFADAGTPRLSRPLANLWADLFPMVAIPQGDDGLGLILLNSNAEANFSFTNALGLVSAEDTLALLAIARTFPRARWIIALHHHLVEYPKPAKTFSERIGTALINGSWFTRQLKPIAAGAIAMHGHRHIDWIGSCGSLRIVSAPSPVMEATNDEPTGFYIHTMAAGADGGLALLQPVRVGVPPEPSS